MFEFGEITDIDAARGYVKVFIPDTGNVSEWIPFIRHYYAQSIPFEIGEQVLVGCTGSGRSFVMGSTPNNIDQPYAGATKNKWGCRFADGTLIEYDQASHHLKLDISGTVEVSAQSVDISAPLVTIDGAVIITGPISAAGGIDLPAGATLDVTGGGNIATDGDVKIGALSLKTHRHIGVTTGTGTSGTPI